MYPEILFEDDYVIMVNKPNNILIHNSYYARNITDTTLLELLYQQFGYHFFPVHRLDRKTSGVLVLAKKKDVVSIFQTLFNSNQIQKIYIAIVRGYLQNGPITIDTPVKNPDTENYKEAATYCEPLCSSQLNIPVHPYDASRYSLVRLIPRTGRMHQLRIHMNKISHPIVGDYKYGDRFHNRMFEHEFNCKNLFLHAYSIYFKHPITNNNIHIKASFPNDWKLVFKHLGWKKSAVE
jgi:tRNA pseudouridine65 synthase